MKYFYFHSDTGFDSEVRQFHLLKLFSPYYKKDAHKETDILNLQNLKFEINLFLTKSIYTLKNCKNIFSLHNDTKFDLENS